VRHGCCCCGDEQRGEAVALFAELLLDAALKREPVASRGGFSGALGSASGGVASLLRERARARRAA